jgi:diguanylate cyclase (GGDEF)-like protein
MECERARRSRQPLSLLLIDVDHFKLINDAYGHPAGDECLCHIARVLSASLIRPADLIARHGGDEFAVLLPETGSRGASTVASRIRSAIAKDVAAGASYATTLSIGAATWNAEEDSSPDELIHAADRALYVAKHNGRDRVELLDLHSLAGVKPSSSMERPA